MTELCRPIEWSLLHNAIFILVLNVILETQAFTVILVFQKLSRATTFTKPSPSFRLIDYLYLFLNHLVEIMVVYSFLVYSWFFIISDNKKQHPSIKIKTCFLKIQIFTKLLINSKSSSKINWSIRSLTLTNSILTVLLLFILFDFFYTIFHILMHTRFFYEKFHKHHHHIHTPTRGYLDATNANPAEFMATLYLHIGVMSLVPWAHGLALVMFFDFCSVMNTLNHSGLAVKVGWLLDTKNHEVHHQLINKNFGLYTQLWDYVFGTYMAYDSVK